MEFSDYLNEQLLKRRRRNPRFSLRAFARILDVNASSLSKLMKGKRLPSEKLLNRFSERLELDAVEKHIMRTCYLNSQSNRKKVVKPESLVSNLDFNTKKIMAVRVSVTRAELEKIIRIVQRAQRGATTASVYVLKLSVRDVS